MKAQSALILRMVAALGGICIVAAALMAWVNRLTAPEIEKAAEKARVEAVADVTTGVKFDNNPVAESRTVATDERGNTVVVYPLVLEGRFTGAAVESYSLEGFDGLVRVMYGFDGEGTLIGYRVLAQSETPGLGARMQQWFSDTVGNRSVIGRNPATTNFHVAKDGGDIDAITAATITSRAFLDALRRAAEAYADSRGQNEPANPTAER